MRRLGLGIILIGLASGVLLVSDWGQRRGGVGGDAQEIGRSVGDLAG